MKKKNGVIRKGLILILAMTALLAHAADCPAFPYRPATALSLQSEYGPSGDPAARRTQLWMVEPQAGAGGAMTLRFFPETIPGADAICVLNLPAPGAATIRWRGAGIVDEKISDTGLLVVPGFPVPCDVLPVGAQTEGRLYRERSEAGGRAFVRTYRVTTQAVSEGEAREKGWIRGEFKGTKGSAIVMITVTDDSGRLVVRQLWRADGAWWLYEETPARRSWLID